MNPSTTAQRMIPLPAGAHIDLFARDFIVTSWLLPTEPATVNRIGVLLDADADLRILDVLIALHFRDLRVRSNLIALAETKGSVICWVGASRDLDEDRRVIQSAADVALRPWDRWEVVPLITVPMRDGVLDRSQLPTNHPLNVLPRRFVFGLVTP